MKIFFKQNFDAYFTTSFAVRYILTNKNFDLWVKILSAGCWENVSGSGKKGGGDETKNQSSEALRESEL